MPLGLMPGMGYEEKEMVLERGESVLFYSDGLVEAHDPRREMFGFPQAAGPRRGPPLGRLLPHKLPPRRARALHRRGWEQEDDITLVTLDRPEET